MNKNRCLASLLIASAITQFPSHCFAVVIDVSKVEFTGFVPNPIQPGQRPTSFSYAYEYDKESNATVNAGFSYSIFLSPDNILDELDIPLGTFNGSASPVSGVHGRITATTSNPNGITSYLVPQDMVTGNYFAFLQIVPRSPHTDPDPSDAVGLLAALVTVGNPPSVVGDYNDNGIVDAADYTIWRDLLGQSVALTNENPDALTPGVVDQEDYDFWKSRFGQETGHGSSSRPMPVENVPEPSTAVLVACLIVVRGMMEFVMRPKATSA